MMTKQIQTQAAEKAKRDSNDTATNLAGPTSISEPPDEFCSFVQPFSS
jgi:hypothetical protein